MPAAETSQTGIDPQVLADLEALIRHLMDKTPIDPELSRRVEERAARITEEIRRVHGVIDDKTFQALLEDDDEL